VVEGSNFVFQYQGTVGQSDNRNRREYTRGKECGRDSGQRKRKGQDVELDQSTFANLVGWRSY